MSDANQMTTDHDLLARIDEIVSETTEDSWNVDVLYPHSYEPLINALRAVVELEDINTEAIRCCDGCANRAEGYNQCLADIKADIKKELG